ncbi:transposase [Candidatus Woesearchaeota archaeon]|nr:transposase [Candidatus Woesearchaeota archaeon]
MKKEVKLIKKIKRLLRRLKCPRHLHRYGPKTYEFYEHLQALLIKAYCKLSYRRIEYLFDLLGIKCPSKSALHYTMQKISSAFWQKMLELTSGGMHYLVALDSTGFSRVNPSYHYLRRIDGRIPKIPVKMSCTFDTKKKKFCAAKIRVLPAHDIKDAIPLISKSNPKIAVADKSYDANSLHEYCNENNIHAHIPLRDYGKVRHNNFTARRKAAKLFDLRKYHRRELIESGYFGLKHKYGSSVSSVNANMIRAEIYSRLICYNYFLKIIET